MAHGNRRDFLPAPTEADQAKIDRRKKAQAAKAASGGVSAPAEAPAETPQVSGVSGSSGSWALLDGVKPEKQEPVQPSLSADAENQIKALQDAWNKANAAGDQIGMETAHNEAEKIRAQAGFLGGADGSAVVPIITRGNAEDDGRPTQQKSAIDGGYTADEMALWVASYDAATSNPYGYKNGFDTGMNLRSKGNMIRQQMYSNSERAKTASEAEREYLHAQNVALAQELEKATGAKSEYDAATGQWRTNNGDLGYGINTHWLNYFDRHAGNTDGLTPEMAEKFAYDTDRYSNYVSQNARHRWFFDESSKYTGQYAEYVDGLPFGQRLNEGNTGSPNPEVDHDLIGDGFNDEAYWNNKAPRDENGNLLPQEPARKGKNNLEDYTKSKVAYVDEYGIIQPGILSYQNAHTPENNMWLNGGNPVADTGDNYGIIEDNGLGWTRAHALPGTRENFALQKKLQERMDNGTLFGDAGANSYEQQINAMYDADLDNQLSALEQQYMQALSDLDKTAGQVDSQYSESRRQMTGDAERQAAAQREIFNARGVNSGTIGQSQLATSGELQNQINAMNNAQASAEAQLQMQRALLAQTYQLQIQQAEAENDYARAQALLQEAQRVDEVLRQQEQQNAQNALAYMQLVIGG